MRKADPLVGATITALPDVVREIGVVVRELDISPGKLDTPTDPPVKPEPLMETEAPPVPWRGLPFASRSSR